MINHNVSEDVQDTIARLLMLNTTMVRRVEAQLASVSDETVRYVITNELPIPVFDEYEIARGFVQALNSDDPPTANEWEMFRINLVRFAISRYNYMDRYLLARVFRDTWKSPLANPISHVIIYVGDYHASKYRRIFKILKFHGMKTLGRSKSRTKKKKKWEKNYQCLGISKFEQPFFHG